MKRNNLLQLLHNYSPKSDEEVVSKARILEFVNQYENCFERSLEEGHVTASAWLLSKDGSKALLMHHSKLQCWVQLGGHCDGNPDALEVALTEAREESGVTQIRAVSEEIFDLDVHLIPASQNQRSHYHYDIRFLLQIASDEIVVKNSESNELRWVGKTISELPTQSPSVVRMFHKWSGNKSLRSTIR